DPRRTGSVSLSPGRWAAPPGGRGGTPPPAQRGQGSPPRLPRMSTTKLVGRENLHDVALPIENRDGGDDVVVRGQSNRVRRIVHGCCPPPLRRRGRCVGRQTLLFEGTIPYRGQGE